MTKYRNIKHVAEKMKFLRIHEGLSCNDLAAVLRLHKDRLSNLESGAFRAELNDIIRYCEYFALDYEEFLFGDFPKFKKDYLEDEKKLLKTIGYKI